MYYYVYKTPYGFDDMIMLGDDDALTGLYFESGKHPDVSGFTERLTPTFEDTVRWLDIYFDGREPDFTPPYKILNSTPFRDEVIEIMKKIPFGKVITYKDIADEIAASHNIKRMSAQAVGGAVGRNPICIIIPCHRVVGSNGYLTGYAGGINNKTALLQNEGITVKENYISGGKDEI